MKGSAIMEPLVGTKRIGPEIADHATVRSCRAPLRQGAMPCNTSRCARKASPGFAWISTRSQLAKDLFARRVINLGHILFAPVLGGYSGKACCEDIAHDFMRTFPNHKG